MKGYGLQASSGSENAGCRSACVRPLDSRGGGEVGGGPGSQGWECDSLSLASFQKILCNQAEKHI